MTLSLRILEDHAVFALLVLHLLVFAIAACFSRPKIVFRSVEILALYLASIRISAEGGNTRVLTAQQTQV
jgi:hypothetical protein